MAHENFKCPPHPNYLKEEQERSVTDLNRNRLLISRFLIQRDIDIHGHSGTGYVAEGVQFSNGKCAVTWKGRIETVTSHDCIESVIELHCEGHESRIVWLDD